MSGPPTEGKGRPYEKAAPANAERAEHTTPVLLDQLDALFDKAVGRYYVAFDREDWSAMWRALDVIDAVHGLSEHVAER